MFTSRSAALLSTTATIVLALACGGDHVTAPPGEIERQAPALKPAFNTTGQTATLFIADAFGAELLRYEVTDGGGAVADGTIATAASVRGVAFSPEGELFAAVNNGSIARFLDPESAATPNGIIDGASTGAPFGAVQWSDFRGDELFQAQEDGTVLRFTFDASGNAVFNGTLAAAGATRGLRTSPATAELFVSNLGNSVVRFLFDASGLATPNGSVTGGGLNHSHGIAFTPWGEMLVANFFGNSVSRFTFDAAGTAAPNGVISGGDMAGPLDLDFTPWGELFVTNHNQNPGKVTRWVFTSEDASATAVYNGSFTVPTNMGVMRFAPSQGTVNAPPQLATDAPYISITAGDVAANTGTVTDTDGDAVTLTASVGTVVDNGDGTWSWSLDTSVGPASSQTVMIIADDGNGGSSQTEFELVVNQFEPAKLFVGEAFGDEVFRFEVTDGGLAILDHTITTNVDQPGGIAFSPSGEMFVSNGTNTGSPGFVSRYLDPEGTVTPNGSFNGASTGAPFQQSQWLTFRNGELFLAQANGVVLRFTFDASGAAVYNGTLGAGANTRGIQVNPANGELLVSNLGNSIFRFLFDASGNAIGNGEISGGGLNHIHGMTFTPWGELLVANFAGNSISRFTFDASGNAVPNGVISGGDMFQPLDVDVSPWGELFVTNHQQVPGKVTRWTFSSEDASATATYSGSFEISANLNVLRFVTEPGGSGPINNAPILSADVDPVIVQEGDVATVTGVITDVDGDLVTLTASVGTVVNNSDGTWSWSLATSDGPAESQDVTIDADDGNGGIAQTSFAVVVNNVAPTVLSVSVPTIPIEISGQLVTVSGTFSDPAGAADETYNCTIDYGDGTGPMPGTVTSGTACTGPGHTYADPGVYTVSMAITDKDGASASVAADDFVVVYDPSGGFVTGGGWIASPAGAYATDPLLAGKASFGFVSRYKRGATVPTGNTEFQFRAGDLEFHSLVYEWLVVNQGGANAQFRGSGEINGSAAPSGDDYQFMIWAGDDDSDTFRIKIWYEDGGEVPIYDNGFDQTIGGGSIKIHQN